MRDLDMIEEKDPNDGGRRLGTIAMATLAFLSLSAAVGVVVGRAARPTEISDDQDPLAALQTSAQLKRPGVATVVSHVDPTEMRFPNALKKQEDRPEVLAALAAAAQEAKTLNAIDGPSTVVIPGVPAKTTAPSAEASASDTSARLSESMPAFVAASSARQAITEAAHRDPLIKAAIPARDPLAEVAPAGEEGQFNLQVISYGNKNEATAFAAGLRAKGHTAFVMAADIPDRGRYYRVRVGPFESRWRAERYRRKFEKTERMNTYVVRRPKEVPADHVKADKTRAGKPL